MAAMDMVNPLKAAIAQVGLSALARGLGVTHQAVRKWERACRLPRTEWTGETRYAETIERTTDGAVTKLQLLAPWPPLKAPTPEPVVGAHDAV